MRLGRHRDGMASALSHTNERYLTKRAALYPYLGLGATIEMAEPHR